MNELDILLATQEELHKWFAGSWAGISIRDLTVSLKHRQDFWSHIAKYGLFFLGNVRDRVKLVHAARAAGLTVRFENGGIISGFEPRRKSERTGHLTK